jgi:hypothetical protein
MHYIQIGRKSITLVFAIVLLQSCGWFGEPETGYAIKIQNKTTDTLVVCFGKNYLAGYFTIHYNMIYPDTLARLMEMGIGVDHGDDPIETFCSEWGRGDSCWIYYYDNELRRIVENSLDTQNIVPNPASLRILWKGPFQDMGDSVNNFFNNQSWRLGNDFDIIFTISESDYNVNK